MEQIEKASSMNTLTPQALAKRMAINAKIVRAILRAEYPREVKNKRREIPATLAKKVEKEFKAKVKEREAKNRYRYRTN